ncbi:MAG TPA: AraC family transcriptional regulator [Ginsengibacter sp.]
MEPNQNILSVALNRPVMQEDMELVHHKVQKIPGTVQYVINRYRKLPHNNFEDTGLMIYNYKTEDSKESDLELIFCVTGNRYCRQKDSECNFCKNAQSDRCQEIIDTVDVAGFRFNSDHLSQFVKSIKTTSFSESILNFSHTSSFSKSLPLCSRTKNVLDALLNHSYSESLENIFINAQTQMLLLYSMECMADDGEDSFSCKFLANDADREKITLARKILLEHISEPLTIKELSRKAAINECYLKKGFKEMYGTTIFDFFQSQRMEHAKYLLYEKGLSVTDVSALLGYSSISHFSTAFKKHTGLKPCELLFH